MKFSEVVAQTLAWLQREGRLSYRALKREFDLDNDYLEDLKEEIIKARRLAIDEDGSVLVWVGAPGEQGAKSKEREANHKNSLESQQAQGLKSILPAPVLQAQVSLVEGSKAQSQKGQPPTPNLQSLAERRQLTVLFCDLVGSTALSEQLDPEEYREVVRAYQQTSTTVIERFDGHIAQYLGDGLLVYFGYPVAHEDDAARAVRAGLEIIEVLRKQVPSPFQATADEILPVPLLRQSSGHALAKEGTLMPPLVKGAVRSAGGFGNVKDEGRLRVRIGIHTGLVVIGEIGNSEKREMLALGETPNIAARVQGVANPDEVVISTATYRLVEGLFECEDRGSPELRGISIPLMLYHVVKEGEAHSRFQVIARKGLTPLVGREHEYGLLQERWVQVKDGTGQVVLLSGEPGIGKSRLVEALKESLTHERIRCLELRCSPYHQNSALYPVIEHLQHMLGFQHSDSPEEKLQKLIVGAHSSAEAIALLAALLSLPHPEGYPALTFSPQKQKEKTYEALVAWLCGEAKQHAMMYAWEDLHWADPSTLELLTLFLAQVPTARLLAVLTFRPEFTSPWGSHSYLSQLTLSRLGRTHVETMVKKVTGSTELPVELVQQIVSKTDGVPLFVEELTKSVVESASARAQHAAPLPTLGIPATLQDALMARLDRLGTAKEIAQLGATLGREFTYEVLHAVSPLNEETLQQGLRRLVETELAFQSGVPPQARYLFKHALVQDTAYQSLLKSNRRQYHKQIAQVLEVQFPQTAETQPELIAHHYTEAGLMEQAIPYWQQAGQKANQRSAFAEATSHLTKGIELLMALPDTPERAQQELTLQLALNDALVSFKGYTALEVGKTVLRTRELCQQIGETPQLAPVLYRLWLFYRNRGELQTARELAEQLLHLARSIRDRYLLALAHSALGPTLHALGELTSARTHLEQTIALYDPEKHPRHTVGTADPRVNCLSYAAWNLWTLGYPEQALKRNQEALALAGGLSHPFSLAYALWMTAWVRLFRREEQLARERAEEVITLSTEQGFPYGLAVGTLIRDLALVEQDRAKQDIPQILQGFMPFAVALLAKAHGKVGQVEEGVTVLAKALALVDKTGERWWEAEMYRLKGELLLAQESREQKQLSVFSSQLSVPSLQHLAPSTQAEAEECFLKAIEIARKQQAKSWELRAATSLARLWQSQGKKTEAHKLLSEVYNWFTEGFDTKDLQEAKVLIEELND